MDVADLIRVHEAWIAHHVAAVGEIDREHRAASVLNGRGAVIVQAGCDGLEVAAGKQVFDAREKRRVDRERVGKRAVGGAGLLDHDLAVAFEDVRADLARVIVDERLDRLLARQDALARHLDALRAERIGAPRPAEGRLGSFRALQERTGRPRRLKRLGRKTPIERLQDRPGDASRSGQSVLNRSPHVHSNPHRFDSLWPLSRSRTIAYRRQPSARRPTCAGVRGRSCRAPSAGSRSTNDKRPWNLVGGQPAAAKAAELEHRRAVAREHQAGDESFAAVPIFQAEHTHINDSGKFPQRALDLFRLHFPPGDVDKR